MTCIKHKYIYDSINNNIYAFKRALILESLPGINACLFFSNNKIFYNDINIEDETTQFNDVFYDIYKKNKKFNNLKFFGILTGSSVVKQSFVKEDFLFYVYAIYDFINKKWFEYSEIIQLLKDNYYVKHCNVLGYCLTNCKNFIKFFDKEFYNKEIYSLLILSYPKIFTDNNGFLDIIEFPNILYQEKIIDYNKLPNYVYSELKESMDIILNDIFFRKIIAHYCIQCNKNLDELIINDINGIKQLAFKKIKDKIKEFKYKQVDAHLDVFIDMCHLKIREMLTNFLINLIDFNNKKFN